MRQGDSYDERKLEKQRLTSLNGVYWKADLRDRAEIYAPAFSTLDTL